MPRRLVDSGQPCPNEPGMLAMCCPYHRGFLLTGGIFLYVVLNERAIKYICISKGSCPRRLQRP